MTKNGFVTGIIKWRIDGNYQSWAWNCKLLLQEREVWTTVDGSNPQPKSTTKSDGSVVQPEASDVQAWEKKNQEALRIISFTVIERLQGPIRMGTTAKGAWDELQNVHASMDKQRKFSLLKQLYRLDMAPGSSLIEHERLFDGLVESLAAMGKTMETEEVGNEPNEPNIRGSLLVSSRTNQHFFARSPQ